MGTQQQRDGVNVRRPDGKAGLEKAAVLEKASGGRMRAAVGKRNVAMFFIFWRIASY
jgi:hypothetical protein